MWLHVSFSGWEWWKPRAPVLFCYVLSNSLVCDSFRLAPSGGAKEFLAAGVADGLADGPASCLNDPPWFCEPFGTCDFATG